MSGADHAGQITLSAEPGLAQIALGNAIRATRHEQGASQEHLAQTAGIDRSYYSATERGEFNITLQVLIKIAAALNTTASVLLERGGL